MLPLMAHAAVAAPLLFALAVNNGMAAGNTAANSWGINMKEHLPLLLVFLLTSCMTPEQIAAQKQEIEQRKAEYCSNLGAPPGSPNYYDCRLRIEQQLMLESQMERQRQAELVQYYDNQRAQSQNEMLNSFKRHRTSCRSYAVGNQLYTDCQ